MEANKFSEETILERVIKIASRFLQTGASHNLDPFSRLVMEAIASEIYLLSDNAANIETRLLEKLATILVPTAKATALPAHAILSVQPLEPEYVLEDSISLRYEDYLINKKFNISEITFFPASPVCLKKGEVRYIIANGKCFRSLQPGNKELVGKFVQTDLVGTLWIGMDMDALVPSLKGLSLYFDCPEVENRNDYIRLSEFAAWTINGEPLHILRGFGQTKESQTVFDSLSGNDVSGAINREICNHYGPQFITIMDDRCFSRSHYPQELADSIAASDSPLAEEFNTPLIWIRIDFPPIFSGFVLEQCTIYPNSFPIVQKKLIRQETKLDELKNIIPLKARNNEHFLSVQSVCDSSGRYYYELTEKSSYRQVHGSYSVRHGGCERFDSRDAKDYLHRLIYLLTEELAIFASTSKENVETITKEMQTLLERMRNLTNGIEGNEEISHYLLLDTVSSKETISVNYWTTNGEIGNHLLSGLPLLPSEESGIDFRTACLITHATGGREPLGIQEKVVCFKNVLTSRGRIFTKDDIVSFCMAEYPGIITSVQVKHGIMQGGTARRSLLRTIDVCVSLSENVEDKFNKEKLLLVLGRKLKECSPETFNYRILLH